MDPDYSLAGFGYTEYSGLDFLGKPLWDTDPDDMYTAQCFLDDSKDNILGWCKKKLDEKYGKERASVPVLFSVPYTGLMPPVSIALLIDEDGFPTDFELFSGRASKSSPLRDAVKNAVEKLKGRNKIQPAVVLADSSLNRAGIIKTLQDMDPGFQIIRSGRKRTDGDDNARTGSSDTDLSIMQQAFISENLRLLKKSLVPHPVPARDEGSIQGQVMVCILAQILLQLLRRRLGQQGTKLKPEEICSNLYGATVLAVVLSETEPLFLLTDGRAETPRGGTRNLSPVHMPDIMRACGLTPLVHITMLPELAEALGTSFASPGDAIPLFWTKSGPESEA